MAKTVVGRRVVVAEECMRDQLDRLEDQKKEAENAKTRVRPNLRKLTYKERLERRLEMADMALIKYEEKLEAGDWLEPEEERLFISHQDSIRKLEATLAALEAKDKGDENKPDAMYCLDLIDAGWTLEDAAKLYKHNPNILDEIEEALRERE